MMSYQLAPLIATATTAPAERARRGVHFIPLVEPEDNWTDRPRFNEDRRRRDPP